MKPWMLAALAWGLVQGVAHAQAPALSLIPRPDPHAVLVASRLAPARSPLPKAPPAFLTVASAPAAVPVVQPVPQVQPALATSSAPAPVATPIPDAAPQKPMNLFQRIFFRAPMGPGITQGSRGAVCGDPQITGETLAPIVGRVRGCGIAAPVKVTAVAGVPLSVPAEVDCETAVALKTWVATALRPAVGNTGGGLKELTVWGSYECRSVDDIRGAGLSRHAKGRALDIGGYTLADGETVKVQTDWRRNSVNARELKAAYHAACGIFRTTIGPDGDRYHQNHMHFDTGGPDYPAGFDYCH